MERAGGSSGGDATASPPSRVTRPPKSRNTLRMGRRRTWRQPPRLRIGPRQDVPRTGRNRNTQHIQRQTRRRRYQENKDTAKWTAKGKTANSGYRAAMFFALFAPSRALSRRLLPFCISSDFPPSLPPPSIVSDICSSFASYRSWVRIWGNIEGSSSSFSQVQHTCSRDDSPFLPREASSPISYSSAPDARVNGL